MRLFFITAVPSFYKNIAFQKLSLAHDVKVFYTNDTSIRRSDDFFKYPLDSTLILKNRGGLFDVITVLWSCMKADKVFCGGWDSIYFWFARLFINRSKLALIVESSLYDYRPSIFLDDLKRYYLRGFSECVVSGTPHEALVKHLGYKGLVKHSKGVGLLDFSYDPLEVDFTGSVSKFLYVGRVAREKGIDLLLEFFIENPTLSLTIVGSLEDELYIDILHNCKNINYLGYKNRDEIKEVFEQNHVFILCSIIEPWGLVIEEALYHGLPVIVSSNVGCRIDVVESYNVGEVFESGNIRDLSRKVGFICNPVNYRFFQSNIAKIDFRNRNLQYIDSFLDEQG
jgi:glycosyltransferase involved in cell wall biosynthesis